MKRSAFVLLLVLFITGCTSNNNDRSSTSKSKSVASWPNVVMYEIFIQSFADSDGDGIGDIKGMTSKLDYLQELGIKGIWLMPMMPSPSYHKYDVTDYYGVHPDYGTMDDFKNFVKEAHDRDIKVVIDMIINHSSNQHPTFLESTTGNDDESRSFYVWASDSEIQKFSSLEKEATGDSYNITQWHEYDNNEEKYYGFFSGMMPDLNYDNEAVREEVIAIGKFWLEEVGVDGFRLDAAKHIYEDSRVADNQNWWKDYRAALEEVKPDNYLVGEVWDNASFIAPFLHGLPALFNFDLAFSMLESIKREKSVSAFISGHSWEVDENTKFEKGYLKNQEIYQQETSDYADAIFLSNHDQIRVLSVLDGDVRKGKLAASLLLTMPGTPYLYYGEEIGMLGMKPDPNIREPFLWTDAAADSVRTNWIDAEYTTEANVAPLTAQMKDKHSIFQHYQSLIQLRNGSKELTFGTFEMAQYGNGSVISFYRSHKKGRVLVVHNLSSQKISFQLKDADQSLANVLFSTYGEQINGHSIDLEGSSSIILSN